MDGEGIIPIFIGVTGHLDLIQEDIPNLEEKVKAIINHVKATCPHSPIKILSPLADGADRLVAKVGLQMGLSLICPLPLPKSEYMRDFKTDESKKEFEALLGQAETVIELPFVHGNTPENIKDYNEPRNVQYASVGAYVAENSQILLALWNGKDTGETGGTAEVVRFKLEGVPVPYTAPLSPLDISDNGPVYHIHAKRKKESDKEAMPECLLDKSNPGWNILYPIGWKLKQPKEDEAKIEAKNYYEQILKSIDGFNKDMVSVKSNKDITSSVKGKNAVEQSKHYLFPIEKQGGLSEGLKTILDVFGYADALAIQNQKPVHRTIMILPISAVLAFFFFGAFDELWSKSFVLLLFPVILGFGYLYFLRINKKNHETKYLDYRVLAEGLRVQFFWKYMSAPENAHESYQRKYKGEIGWIAQAIRNASLSANIEQLFLNNGDKCSVLETVRFHWVDNQKTYLEKKVQKNIHESDRQERITKRFFVAAFIFVLLLFIMKAVDLYKDGSFVNIMDMADIKDWGIYSVILVLVDTCLAIGAGYQAWVEKRAFADEVKQYQRMESLFMRGSSVISELLKENKLDAAEKVLIEIGKEALTENGDWLMLQRSRPLEMPIG